MVDAETERRESTYSRDHHHRKGLIMLARSEMFSGFAVDDIPAAKAFYSATLGLEVTEANGMLQLHSPGGRHTLIYPKADHVAAGYTILNFPVDDIDATIDALAVKGVLMTRYDGMPQDEKGILRGRAANRGPDIAWFTDPAGNVLSVLCG
jgi:catechol 2,3-dioxygenase-like lactoylglutathione lyase family enzyme